MFVTNVLQSAVFANFCYERERERDIFVKKSNYVTVSLLFITKICGPHVDSTYYILEYF